jgi:hypothetical protein
LAVQRAVVGQQVLGRGDAVRGAVHVGDAALRFLDQERPGGVQTELPEEPLIVQVPSDR